MWANQDGGLASLNSQVSIGVGTTAAPCPPASEPANVQLPPPMAMPRTARSAAALKRPNRHGRAVGMDALAPEYLGPDKFGSRVTTPAPAQSADQSARVETSISTL
jgi:hypothetical protein